VSGLVRDSAGIPQIGAEVQLLRPDLTVVASVYTNSEAASKSHPSCPAVTGSRPCMSYLPALRENVRVRAGTSSTSPSTLSMKSCSGCPLSRAPAAPAGRLGLDAPLGRQPALLRWLEDGPLVVVSDGTGAAPNSKPPHGNRTGRNLWRERRTVLGVGEDTPSNGRELLARVDFAPNTDAGLESMLGFRQDPRICRSVQSVAAVAVHPEVEGPGGEQGLDEAAIRTWETMRLGDEFEVEAGSTEVLGRFADQSADTVVAALPDAEVTGAAANQRLAIGWQP